MKCSVCGCEDSKGNPVTLEPDPYASEIKGNETPIWECKRCRQESVREI